MRHFSSLRRIVNAGRARVHRYDWRARAHSWLYWFFSRSSFLLYCRFPLLLCCNTNLSRLSVIVCGIVSAKYLLISFLFVSKLYDVKILLLGRTSTKIYHPFKYRNVLFSILEKNSFLIRPGSILCLDSELCGCNSSTILCH